ncbi:MAG TPA: cytidylate kinase-like family protein [Candidatus Limivivens merdigallinarum]|uniref:Cytidylate kinase-like family protein n=1 Tax=Candidatus Limivivens merdigallinarum TaxID=2840859 RepID=A0A9D0ZT95_9FIRM|nr:cytidylate kinase-like family protein [Candidatus Limivivens merdigallinarum]
MNKIITVGREFGSGGRELGKRLADLLHIAYYDKEIVTEIAKKTSLAESYVHQVMEHNPTIYYPITIGHSFYPMVNPIMDLNNSIYVEQSRIIKEMADESDCVIVGRCADYILRERKPMRLFVYADMQFKMDRCRKKAPSDEEPLSDKELKQHITSIDKNRSKYYQFFTGQKWGERINYDFCINTTNLSIKEVALAISRMF